MSLDCSNPRHVAGLDNRAFRNRRRDAKSPYSANDGSGWVPRSGSGDDWHSGRVAMGTCGRHPIACWMEFVRGRSNAPSQRAELVCGCPRATGATLCSRGTSKALRRKAPIGLTRAASGSRPRSGPRHSDPARGKCVRLMALAEADVEMAGGKLRPPVLNHEPQTQSRLSTWQSSYTEPPH